ncbi:uncharacterized protein CBL_04050 [Carabus blaptoides fortunei]
MKVFIVCLIVFTCLAASSGKVYTRCGLSQELNKRNFPRSFLSNWVCLIESESGKDTSKVTNKANGSKSYGLFQINSREWCVAGRAGGKCGIRCEDLINEDLADDVACAKKVYSQKGFQAWDGWVRSCYKKSLNDVSNC